MRSAKSLSFLLTLLFSSTYVLADTDATADAATTAPPPIVTLPYAKYQGIPVVDTTSGVTNTNFLGMRFAAPPTGPLRFSAPHAPATTAGVQVAGTQPNRCPMGNIGAQPTSPYRTTPTRRDAESELEARDTLPPFSEDCLFLNVYVPGKLGSKSNLPVVVWIYGGGYTAGSAVGLAGTDAYNGNDLLRESGGNVVAVVLQYRLGAFGFLPGAKVKAGGVLNAGLLDQQFALKWVQSYISKFGGDPSKVTIWGQSAGAGSVIQHVVANGGKTSPPLFRAAMTSSTFLPSQYKYNDPFAEKLYTFTVQQAGCSSAADSLACLRSVSTDTLATANLNIALSGFFGTFIYAPVVDGTFITDRPSVLLKQKKLNAHVLYSVTNTLEGNQLVDDSTASTGTVSNYLAQLFPKFGPAQISAGVATYSHLGLSYIDTAKLIMTDSIFVCPTYWMLTAFGVNAWKGAFAIPQAFHGTDVVYYFPNGNTPPYNNPSFVKSFSEDFMDVVMNLNPNVKWDPSNITPPFSPWVGSNEMLFNKTAAGLPDIRPIKTNPAQLTRCNYWDSVSAYTAQ